MQIVVGGRVVGCGGQFSDDRRAGIMSICISNHSVTGTCLNLLPWDPQCITKDRNFKTDFWTLWEKAKVRWSERIALKYVYYQVWNRSPVQVGCMGQVLRAGTLGWPRGMGWWGRWEGGSGWGKHVNPWLIHVNVWQKPLQYCKVISLQLIKIKGKKWTFYKFLLTKWFQTYQIQERIVSWTLYSIIQHQ